MLPERDDRRDDRRDGENMVRVWDVEWDWTRGLESFMGGRTLIVFARTEQRPLVLRFDERNEGLMRHILQLHNEDVRLRHEGLEILRQGVGA